MSVKSELLKILEENRNIDMSGEMLAKKLDVTRTSIWKAIKALKEEGHRIETSKKMGYRLAEDSDVLSLEGIENYIDDKYKSFEIQVFDQIDSTNLEAKRQALLGKESGLAIIANTQSKGRGRRGRSFFSPQGSIYLSVLFKPQDKESKDLVLITTAASVAVCRAIKKVLNKSPKIKWVNDLYYDGKKICGILTEAVSDIESGQIDQLIVGIGLNYKNPKNGYPEEIEDVAGALCKDDETIPRNHLLAQILNELYYVYENIETREFFKEYKEMSNVIGKRIKYSTSLDLSQDIKEARAIDILEDGGLLLEDDDGQRKVIHTGEITIRVM